MAALKPLDPYKLANYTMGQLQSTGYPGTLFATLSQARIPVEVCGPGFDLQRDIAERERSAASVLKKMYARSPELIFTAKHTYIGIAKADQAGEAVKIAPNPEIEPRDLVMLQVNPGTLAINEQGKGGLNLFAWNDEINVAIGAQSGFRIQTSQRPSLHQDRIDPADAKLLEERPNSEFALCRLQRLQPIRSV